MEWASFKHLRFFLKLLECLSGIFLMGFPFLHSSSSSKDMRVKRDERKKKGDESCSREGVNDGKKSLKSKPSIKSLTGWKRLSKLWATSPSLKFLSLASLKWSQRSKSARDCFDSDRCFVNGALTSFTFEQLQNATNNFSKENLIGQGGFADVYKGCLPHGQLVAIKQLKSGMSGEEELNFLSEIGVIAHVNHPNTAKMVGYGVEGGAFIVLKLSSLGSLGSLLQSSREKLNWEKRYKIILGTAEGLLYLHEDCQRRIIHRDIKADNILLSEDYEPQICDFGLSKWLPQQLSHHNTSKFEGTFGYMAPEYFMYGIVDERTDVFSFGVLLLELLTGRQAIIDTNKSLVLLVKPLLDKNAMTELVDPSLGEEYNRLEMDWVISTASKCIDDNPILRPRMRQVVTLLKGSDKKMNRDRQTVQWSYSEKSPTYNRAQLN